MAYTIKVRRHEIVRDSNNNIISGVVGVVVENDETGLFVYRDKVWTVGAGGDFETVPTKAAFKAAVKDWLITVPQGGLSILQSMKNETLVSETVTVFKPGDAGSMVDEEIQEAA